MSCTASGVDWKCDRIAHTKTQCHTHYEQMRTRGFFTQITTNKFSTPRPESGMLQCSRCKKVVPRPTQSAVYCRPCAKDVNLLRLYGITLAERDEMIAAQGGRCKICATDTPSVKGWVIDHDHSKPKGRESIRKILCNSCNLILGCGRDSASILRRAADYLDEHGTTDGFVFNNS